MTKQVRHFSKVLLIFEEEMAMDSRCLIRSEAVCSRCFPVFVLLAALVLSVCSSGSYAATIDVTAYGANGNDTLDDTSAIQSAVAVLTDNDTLLFPEASFYYKVAIDANFTIWHKDGIKIIIRGRILAEGTPDNGDNIFNLYDAHDITFIGDSADAIIEGSDEYLYFPDGWNGPSLIRASVCNQLIIRKFTLRNGPRSSVLMLSAKNGQITDCVFQGGPLTMTPEQGTHIHGILFTGTTDLLIEGNRFIPRADGGKAYTWIDSGSTSYSPHTTIVNNHFESSFDHSLYTMGIRESVIANNTFVGCEGSPIKTYGFENIIVNNNIYNSPGAIEVRDSQRCIVANNIIDRIYSVAISVTPYSGVADSGPGVTYGTTNHLIDGNIIRYYGVPYSYEAIRVWGRTVSGTKITNNTIIHANHENPQTREGSIVLISDSGTSYNVTISENVLQDCGGHGIHLHDIQDSLISDNIINIPVGKIGIREVAGSTNNLIADNLLSEY